MNTINGVQLRGMLESACANLHNRSDEVNALNVFPVPDGDTGTNMSLTFTSGVNEVRNSGSEELKVVTKTLSRGLLMGARGNSGVILSQIFRGFHGAVGEQTELTAVALADAFMAGAMKAYKAVMRPVEGTILTVIREASEYAQIYTKEHPEIDVNEYMDVLCKEAKASLDRTPELLPVLKEARVVDSGGMGLLCVLDGFRAYLEGAPITEKSGDEKNSGGEFRANGYRTEMIVKLSDQGTHLFHDGRFRDSLGKLGENITVVNDNEVIKVRVTTMQPGDVLNLAQRYGEFEAVQIDSLYGELKPSILNSTEEKPVEEEPKETPEFGIITCCAGEGLANLFREYRCDYVVSGGQTMNPSTQDFVEAIGKVPAKHIFLLPNNGNIVMAAKQAAEVIEDKDVIVLETKSVPQGLNACIAFNPEDDVETNTTNMKDAIGNVVSGSVTYAIKDTTVDGRPIHSGDYMGIREKDIVVTHPDKVEAACGLIKEMCNEDTEIITLIRGADATEEEVNKVSAFIEENYEVDVDVEEGGQPVYSFLIGAE